MEMVLWMYENNHTYKRIHKRMHTDHIYWYFEFCWACAILPNTFSSSPFILSQFNKLMSLFQARVQSTYVSVSFSLLLIIQSEIARGMCRIYNIYV